MTFYDKSFESDRKDIFSHVMYMTEYTELFKIECTNKDSEKIENLVSDVQDIREIYGVSDISTPSISEKNIPIDSFKIDITYDSHLTDRTVLAQNIEEIEHFDTVTFA